MVEFLVSTIRALVILPFIVLIATIIAFICLAFILSGPAPSFLPLSVTTIISSWSTSFWVLMIMISGFVLLAILLIALVPIILLLAIYEMLQAKQKKAPSTETILLTGIPKPKDLQKKVLPSL